MCLLSDMLFASSKDKYIQNSEVDEKIIRRLSSNGTHHCSYPSTPDEIEYKRAKERIYQRDKYLKKKLEKAGIPVSQILEIIKKLKSMIPSLRPNTTLSSVISPPSVIIPSQPISPSIIPSQSKPITPSQSKPITRPQSKPITPSQSKPITSPQSEPIVVPQCKHVTKYDNFDFEEPDTQMRAKINCLIFNQTNAVCTESSTPIGNYTITQFLNNVEDTESLGACFLETPNKKVETVSKKAETVSKKAETPNKEVETVSKKVETPNKKAETVSKKVETPNKKAETPNKEVETVSKKVETPNKKVETPNKKVETPNKKVETPNKKAETPNKEVETPNKKVETPNKKVEIPNKKAETPNKKAETMKRSKLADKIRELKLQRKRG